jgi:predicted ester cyclase
MQQSGCSADLRAMYQRWIDMWNGETDLADELMSPTCPIHQPPNDFRGAEGLRQMVEMGRAPFEDTLFSIEVPPIVEGNRLAARWTMTGRYRGGLPGTTAAPGTEITFGGIDIWRVEDGRIVEYWVSSDGLHMMAQLNPEES